ncbi:FtsX-like permease family protein [Actinomadura sp. 21ATH]|uniref:FtsX-like permease family protein n=1 Tax=Actinomadura sp. 21ATH TaxID=1735444 RepID=UPI0035C185D9
MRVDTARVKSRHGVFVALAFAAMLAGACGVLLETALRAHAPTGRYAPAAAVVSAPQEVSARIASAGSEPETRTLPAAERARVPAGAAERLRRVPGVRDVVADVSFPVAPVGGRPLTGHNWSRLAGLRAGRVPRAAHEVALPRSAGFEVGRWARLQVDGAPRPYLVTGLVSSGAYFAQTPARVDALLVFGTGVDVDALRAAAPGLKVSTGAARGDVADLAVPAARPGLVEMALSFGGAAIMTALIVVGGLIALSIRERAREFALLRAIGATSGQVRAAIVRESARTAVRAGLAGGPLSLPLGAAMHAAMVRGGVLPEGFGLSLSPAPAAAGFLVAVAAAVPAALVASLRLARIRPVQALGESAAEPAELPRWRRIAGVAFLVVGVNALGVSGLTSGPTAAASVGGLVLSLIAATAFLGPVIARFGARTLGGAVRRLDPRMGNLAARAAGAAAMRAGAVLTPVALAVAFAGTQLFVQSTLADATREQARDATRAGQVLVADGTGLPAEAARAVRAVPGVTAATAVKRTTVVMAVSELGDKQLRSVPARGVSPEGLERTTDPGVVEGRLADLRGTAVALSRDVAGGTRVGAIKPLWLGDGTRVRPRVVAIYERGLGLGDVLLPRDLVAAHATSPLDDHVLVAGGADLRPVAARYAGARALPAAALDGRLSQELRMQGFMSRVAVAAIAGFIVIGLVTTLALATSGRGRELALLRLAGATRRQVLRAVRLETAIVLGTGLAAGTLIAAVTLAAFAAVVTGLPLPSVSPVPTALIVLFIAGSGTAATMLPARVLLCRGRPTLN